MQVTEQKNGRISKHQCELIADLVRVMKQKDLSQAGMATLCGISSGTISELINNRRPFGPRVLGPLARFLGDFSSNKERLFTNLRQYQKLINIAKATRKKALFVMACGNTGVGKTTAMRQLYAEEAYTFYLKIEDDLTWRELLRKIALSLGIKDLPYRAEALREAIQQRVELLASEDPLLIIDEAEELTDSVARKLKRLHTLTEGQLGVLIVAHPNLKRRLARASGLNPDTGHRFRRNEHLRPRLARRR